jgi:Protein of unknown function (DUF2795)
MAATTTREKVRECLNDVDFPAARDALVETAERNGCPDTARALRAIPPETYANLTEVLASVTLSDDELSDSERAAGRRTHTKRGLAQGEKDIGPANPIIEELGENRDS